MEVEKGCNDSIGQIIQSGDYTKEDFNKDGSNLFSITHWLKQEPISPSMLAEVVELLKFYGMPFLFQLRLVYDRMDNNVKKNCQRYLQTIMMITKDYLDGEKPQELSFLYDIEGVKHKINYISREKSQRQLQFINYWRALRNKYLKIISIPPDKFEVKEQLIDQFFEKDALENPNFNTFEKMVVDYYTDKVLQVNTDIMAEKSPVLNATVSRTPISKQDSSEEEEFPKPKQKKSSKQERQERQPNTLKEDDLRRAKEEDLPMCCRRFFFKDEVLIHAESSILEFKNYRFPWHAELENTLLKAICGFLNMKGGIILIGVAEHEVTKKPVVSARNIYDENTKEQVHFKITNMAKKIYPDIVTNNKYIVQFVPVKSRDTNNFIAGAYVIRVIVEYGERDSIYFFNDTIEDLYMFRQEKQVIRKKTSEALEILKKRIKEPMAVPPKKHEGPCLQPDHGKPIYGNPMESDKREKEEKKRKYEEEECREQKRDQKPKNGPKQNAPQMPSVRPMPPPEVTPQKKSYDTRLLVLTNIPYFSVQVREVVEKVAGNAKIQARAYKDLPDIAILEYNKKYHELINNNIAHVKSIMPECKDLVGVDPTTTLVFRGKLGGEHLQKAVQILQDKRICLFEPDSTGEEKLIRFGSIQDCINCFFIIRSLGLNPRFSNR